MRRGLKEAQSENAGRIPQQVRDRLPGTGYEVWYTRNSPRGIVYPTGQPLATDCMAKGRAIDLYPERSGQKLAEGIVGIRSSAGMDKMLWHRRETRRKQRTQT